MISCKRMPVAYIQLIKRDTGIPVGDIQTVPSEYVETFCDAFDHALKSAGLNYETRITERVGK